MSIAALSDQTYIVRHNPNCSKPFQIIVGHFPPPITATPRAYYIAIDRPGNLVGHGMTLDEAAADIAAAVERRDRLLIFRELWDGI